MQEVIGDHYFWCPIHQPPHGLHDLMALDNETTKWLFNICPEI